MSIKIQFRRGTLSEWISNSGIVLASGEPAYETDTNRLKIGNGISSWNNLPYLFSGLYISSGHTHLSNSIYTVGDELPLSAIDGFINTVNDDGYSVARENVLGAAALSHSHGNITNSGSIGAVSNLPLITTTNGVVTTGAFGTGVNTFASGNHTHTTNDITNFNSAVSGLLPVTNITAGSNITISNNNGNFTINSTGNSTSISNPGNNRLLTSDGTTSGLTAQSNLTFDGSLLNINGSGYFGSGITVSGISKIGGMTTHLYSDGDFIYIKYSNGNTLYSSEEGIFTDINNTQSINYIDRHLYGTGLANFGAPALSWGEKDSIGIKTAYPNYTLDVNGSGNFASGLFVSGVSVSTSGHTHSPSNIIFSSTDTLLGRSSAGSGSGQEIVCTAAGRALIDDATASNQRTTLDLGTTSTVQFKSLGIGTAPAVSGTIVALTTETVDGQSVIKGLSTEISDAVSWRGRAMFGSKDLTFLLGTYNGIAGLGAHSWEDSLLETGASWADVVINPDGGADVLLSCAGWDKDEALVAIRNSTGKITFADGGDRSKKAEFDLSNINSSTTRIYAFPDQSGTLALTSNIIIPTIFTPNDNQSPATNAATTNTRNRISILEFDANTEESAFFVGALPSNADLTNGIRVRLWWMAATATSGNVRWAISFERVGTDNDADSFSATTQANGAANATSGVETVTTITATAANIDGLAAGERYRLRVARIAADATNDTMLGDAQLICVEVRAA